MTDWIPQSPRPITPVPAAGHEDLRGRRVLVGHPGLGWRGDLRADAAVVQGARTYIPILTEQEWYRAELEQLETFAPLVPVDRVWLEALGTPISGEDIPTDLFERLVSLDTPAPRYPVSARLVSGLSGRRVVRVDQTGEHRDLRAVTEAHQNTEGDICVRVTRERDWYRWAWTGQTPKTTEIPVYLLWVE